MATVLRAWTVEDGGLTEIPDLPADQQGLIEAKLEDWLASQPDAIEDNLLIIGRQVSTSSGPLDLLGLTAEGKLVVIELKRDRAPRETVAQAIDYASWIAVQTQEEIRRIATEYLKRPLEDAFQDRFGGETLPELQMKSPSILVVASRLDAATERMIEFLSEQHGMDIDGLVFRYIKLSSGAEVLIRSSVVSEEQRISTQGDTYRVSVDSLLSLALDRRAAPIVAILRHLGEFLGEDPTRTYGGSFRYWQERMLCGVNVASNWGAPQGAIDVWVSYGKWAQMTGLPEESFIAALKADFEYVQEYEGARQMMFRIGSEENATQFVELLRGWTKGSSAEPAEVESGSDGKGDEANIPA
ncbi:MAG: DUF91 domain-containing protein [Chloroflexi bacterium]|nr:DUF91 domain-containing protein [Chloroflexota bacterium]